MENTNIMIKAVLYARYSPRREESDSIQTQMADLHAWCERNDVVPILCCFDPAVSGTVRLRKRPGLSSALDHLKKDMYLVVRNLHRMARGLGAAIEIEDEVYKDIKAQLASIEDGGVLGSDPNSKFARHIKYCVHEFQRVESNQRTSRRMLQLQAEGRAMGGNVPFGYSCEDGMLVPNEDEHDILDLVTELRASGLGCRRIARKLNEKGLTTRRDASWSSSAVQHLLKKHGDTGESGSKSSAQA